MWFTLQQGRISEVFYPDLSTPSTRNLELVVTDGRSFTDRESTDMRHGVARPDVSSLRFTQTNTDKGGQYRIVKSIVTDPRRDSVVLRVRLVSLDGRKYHLYALHDPALGNDGEDDRARTSGGALVARDGSAGSALVSRPGFDRTSSGYVGTASDGWRDLEAHHRISTSYADAGPGNVVQVGRVTGVTGRPGHRTATLALGFGGTPAVAKRTAATSAATSYATTARRYDAGWHSYLGSLRGVPASAAGVRRQYLASALVLAAAEDKLHPGRVRRLARAHRGSGATTSTGSRSRRVRTTRCGRATPTSSAPRCGPTATRRPRGASSTGCSPSSRRPTARSRRTPT